MKFQHTKCGGDIDTKKRQCLKCGKKWNPITFLLTPSEIKMVPTPMEDRLQKLESRDSRKKHANWAEKIPGATVLPSILPNWPRWIRILVVVGIIIVITVVILMVWG